MVLSLRTQRIALMLILVLALCLRLKGIHNPVLDHPAWRQGDMAAIARNFALVDANPLHPQADYNGPGPNYVELELQIVPYAASVLYRYFGIHESFGRGISIFFSLSTVLLLFSFGRWLYASAAAGLCAALFYAIAPGAFFYGRTFQPDTTMAFFLTAALYVCARAVVTDGKRSWAWSVAATPIVLLALLAKSVSIMLFIPFAAMTIAKHGFFRGIFRPQNWLIAVGSLLPFALYAKFANELAVWHWASGITRLHVIPDLIASFTSVDAFTTKVGYAVDAMSMLAHTMLGPVLFTLLILSFLAPLQSRSRALTTWWLVGACIYLYVVVTVERVDYYLFPFVPLAALTGGAYIGAALSGTAWSQRPLRARLSLAATLAVALTVTIIQNRREVATYYDYSDTLLAQVQAIDRWIPQNSLVVVGHLDPSLLYYLNRRGWMEDPFTWTTFNEQSAIAKGARYFIDVEPSRLRRNVELHAWLQRFPKLRLDEKTWDVYITDPDNLVPGAEAAWRAFRAKERASKKRAPFGRPTPVPKSLYGLPDAPNATPKPSAAPTASAEPQAAIETGDAESTPTPTTAVTAPAEGGVRAIRSSRERAVATEAPIIAPIAPNDGRANRSTRAATPIVLKHSATVEGFPANRTPPPASATARPPARGRAATKDAGEDDPFEGMDDTMRQLYPRSAVTRKPASGTSTKNAAAPKTLGTSQPAWQTMKIATPLPVPKPGE